MTHKPMTEMPICCVSGRIAGDSDACGDCDPCILGQSRVPASVRKLLNERDEWRNKYADAMGEIDRLRTPAPLEGERANYARDLIRANERWQGAEAKLAASEVALAEARRATLEEAIDAIGKLESPGLDENFDDGFFDACEDATEAIRALSPQPKTEGTK